MMMAPVHRVAIVAAPQFGERLRPLANDIHAWVIDTPANRRVAEEIWAASAFSLERGVTLFRAEQDVPAEAWMPETVEQIELHHGVYSHRPPVSILEIYGVPLSERLRSLLAEAGFGNVTEVGDTVLAEASPGS